jgi:hypothetical protein
MLTAVRDKNRWVLIKRPLRMLQRAQNLCGNVNQATRFVAFSTGALMFGGGL